MPDSPFYEDPFLKQVTTVIEENMEDEQFGVSELAQQMNLSRSGLLRKVKKAAAVSASQLIRQVRLNRAMEMLKENDTTVSEVAYQVGFSSTSYFIKCFREHYGYPPGEAEKRDFDESEAPRPVQTHRLVAIMFTDIQGYTALMQQDEEKAVRIRNRHREIFNSTTEKFKGKILQYYGDGTLSIFQSAIDAVKCGIEMQRAFRIAPPVPVRIGIHSGDIIFSEEEIIGDGVNVASRVESLAAAGSVFISEKVYDEVKNQPGIQTSSLGTFEFKNVKKPLEVFAVANPGLVVPGRDQLTGKLKVGAGSKRGKAGVIGLMITLALILGSYLMYHMGFLKYSSQSPVVDSALLEKSIAVLPFINDSNDSTNVYIINGLMESLLNDLQKIEDLRVISRTSVERYRNTTKSVPEIAQELGVRYFVEGSGQKIGDQILLNIQLIEAATDRHLWSEQYDREVADIFGLQREVARKIVDEIEVIITPEEAERLEKVPTDNLEAYDLFLQGLQWFHQGNREGLEKAITLYEQAVGLDPTFARAYGELAIAYYYLDLDFLKADKQHLDRINYYADKALLNDPQLPEGLVAKALFYIQQGRYELALPHLEKALAVNPNYALAINVLADFYTTHAPDSKKYLEYALRGIRIDVAAQDSTMASYTYLHISNALIQSGFVEEAEKYINKSLAFDPGNLFSAYVKAYILYAEHRDLARTREDLLEILSRDTTRLDVIQEVAKLSYYLRDYETAYRYYKKFTDIREAYNLAVFPAENAKIAMVMQKVGKPEEAEKYMQFFREYTAADQSIYQDLNQAMIAAYEGDHQRAIEQLRAFSEEENFFYWILLFLEIDPMMDEVKELPAFQEIMRDLNAKFRGRHERMRTVLEEQNLI